MAVLHPGAALPALSSPRTRPPLDLGVRLCFPLHPPFLLIPTRLLPGSEWGKITDSEPHEYEILIQRTYKQTNKPSPRTPVADTTPPGCAGLLSPSHPALRLPVLSLRASALQMHDHYRPPLRIPAAIPSSRCSLPA